MKSLSCLISCLTLAALPLCVAAQQSTARDYYNELQSVQGIHPFAAFVCFPNDQLETFFVMGRSSTFEASLKAKGTALDSATRNLLQQVKGENEKLYWEGFNKGVGSGGSILDRGAWPGEWVGGPSDSGITSRVQITWPTLRYRMALSVKGTTGEYASDGRCEPIPVEKAGAK